MQRALEYGRSDTSSDNPRISYLKGYNQALEDTHAPQMIEMLKRIYDDVNFQDWPAVKLLIQQATTIK